MAHPAVAEAAVIGVRHPKWDERPLLLVVKKAEAPAHARRAAQVLRGKGGQVVDPRRRRVRRAAAAHRHGQTAQDQAARGLQGAQAAYGVTAERSGRRSRGGAVADAGTHNRRVVGDRGGRSGPMRLIQDVARAIRVEVVPGMRSIFATRREARQDPTARCRRSAVTRKLSDDSWPVRGADAARQSARRSRDSWRCPAADAGARSGERQAYRCSCSRTSTCRS